MGTAGVSESRDDRARRRVHLWQRRSPPEADPKERHTAGERTTQEISIDYTFEHGPHGEIVLQKWKSGGAPHTLRMEWEGTFKPAEAVLRPRQPWERPSTFGLSMPLDLTVRELRASMPPFVFEGTVTMTSDRHGLESILTYDRNGRMTKHQGFINKFVGMHEYDERGLHVKATRHDGRVGTYRYDDLAGVGLTMLDRGETVEQVYQRDEAGELVGGTHSEAGAVSIVMRFGPCEVLK